MGSDDLHHKRRTRGKESLRRRKAIREPYDVVLIVCEGTKTEPNYFCDIRDDYRLNSANIRVAPGEGSDPLSVVNTAIKLFEETNDYDVVFCVFDKDRHPNYDSAIAKVESAKLKKRDGRKIIGAARFETIISVPCFEYWLLLHYRMTDNPYAQAGERSICEQVIHDLNRFIPDYSKGCDGIYDRTKGRLNDAIRHAEQVLIGNAATGTDNPSTHVHELIGYLQGLKK